MSDSDSNKKTLGVPSWQLKAKEQLPQKGEDQLSETPNRTSVVEQAKRFLEEDEVRDASTDKKIAFLETKGLRSNEIEELLGVTRNPEASSPSESPEPTQLSQSQPAQEQPSSTQLSQPSPPPPQAQRTYDSPPIITYPEFLTTPQSPSPLITKTRLLTALYLFGGLSALLYGTNTYLVTPMLASLTDSRLSLAATSKTNLEKLITKLEGMVSEIPAEQHKHLHAVDEDTESDEDPSEMFHRDVGVQTSLPESRASSPTPDSTETVVGDQEKRLKALKEKLAGLIEDSSSEGHDVAELEGTMGVLREYLDGLAYVVPTYGYGGYGGNQGYGAKEQDDEIAKVKAGIRGVKGVLLSARSFPGAVRVGGT